MGNKINHRDDLQVLSLLSSNRVAVRLDLRKSISKVQILIVDDLGFFLWPSRTGKSGCAARVLLQFHTMLPQEFDPNACRFLKPADQPAAHKTVLSGKVHFKTGPGAIFLAGIPETLKVTHSDVVEVFGDVEHIQEDHDAVDC